MRNKGSLMSTIPGILIAQAAARPDALALRDRDWNLSYSELHKMKMASRPKPIKAFPKPRASI